MGEDITVREIGIYLLNRVEVTLKDDSRAEGILQNIAAETITVEGREIMLSDVADIRLVGELTDYDVMRDTGMIGNFTFAPEACRDAAELELMRYGDFACTVSCHLKLASGKICANDIRLVSHIHKICAEKLSQTAAIYSLFDGTFLVGRLQQDGTGMLEQSGGGQVPVDFAGVKEIFPLPETNDSLHVTMKDGSCREGVVSAVTDTMFVLIGEGVSMIPFADMQEIRYCGKVVRVREPGSRGKTDTWKIAVGSRDAEDGFWCRVPEHSGAAQIGVGDQVSFVPGITDCEWIAKDVRLVNAAGKEEPAEAGYTGRGIILFFPNALRTNGFIGNCYVSQNYAMMENAELPRGNIMFSQEQIDFGFKPGNIYVVSYTCAKEPGEVVQEAVSVTLEKMYPYADYAKVWIDGNGEVKMLPVSVFYAKKFVGQDVEVLLSNGERTVGKLKEYTDEKMTLLAGDDGAEETVLQTGDIAQVRYFGPITAYRTDNGTGYISGEYWFHVNNLTDAGEASQLVLGRRVSFTLEQTLKGKLCAAKDVALVSEKTVIAEEKQEEPKPKRLRGYIVKYMIKQPVSAGFGFIVPEEELEAHLEDKEGTVYFKQTDIDCETMPKLNTKSYYYEVLYTPYTLHGKTCAKDVKIGAGHPYPEKKSTAPVAVTAVTKKIVSKTLPLAEYLEAEEARYAGASPKLGIISLYNGHYALISDCYINKKLVTDQEYALDGAIAIFNPELAQIETEETIKTAKHCYLVKYVPGGTMVNEKTGMEHPSVDYNYPVLVLASFAKSQYICLKIEAGALQMRKVEQVMSTLGTAVPEQVNFDIPELCSGESVIFEMTDSTAAYHVIDSVGDDFYRVKDGKQILKNEIQKIYRFGVVTDFNMEEGIAVINRVMNFSLTLADPNVINILKSQMNVTRLHVIFACEDNRITEVHRISEAYSGLIRWQEGTVTQCDELHRAIVVDQKARHYMSVLSDGMINRAFKSHTLTGQRVFVKCVHHVFVEEGQTVLSLAESVIEIRCQRETATIQYDAGRDIYLGYRNATKYYPVYGASQILAGYVNKETAIVFAPGADGLELEARLVEAGGAQAQPEAQTEEFEADEASVTLETAIGENLAKFCMEQVDLSQLLLKGVTLNEQSMPENSENAQRAVDILHGQPGELQSFAAAKIALAYPEVELEHGAEAGGKYDRENQIGRLLIGTLQKNCRKIGLDANMVFGEQTYYLSVLLRYPLRKSNKKNAAQFSMGDCLYQLFLQDFGTREQLANYLQQGKTADRGQLETLLNQNCRQMSELISHMMLLDQKSMETVCAILKKNTTLTNELLRYAVQIDDMIRTTSLAEALQALRERYKKDRSRFSANLTGILSGSNISADVRELILNMQVRFLKLAGKDDRARFEKLQRACMSVCDYTNQPGFSLQERLLRDAYREIRELEEEIKKHPSREAVEILWMCTDGADGANIFAKLKKEIAQLLNSMYQDEKTRPKIWCKPNQELIENGQKTFWLIVGNGAANMNLQSADNVGIILESYTEGVDVPSKIVLEQKHLAAGDQIPVEVAISVEEGYTGSLNIGWSVEYEYTTAFLTGENDRNGSLQKKTVREDAGNYLELQYGTGRMESKDTGAENPYLEPSQGQPLEDNKMFFGREEESREIRSSILRTVDGEEQFIPGSAVIIHGQKKSGKTSLVYQIKNYIKDNEKLRQKAIMLNFNNILDETGGVELLPYFKRSFYANILSRFENEIYDHHPDVVELLRQNQLEIPDLFDPAGNETWAALFERFFREFFRYDGGEHVILLFMDEFTLLCTTIMSEIRRDKEKNESLAAIPNFIKTFSQYGFIQVIIGHEAMMRAFDSLGVLNHTAEFAKSVEIAALDEEASVRLVKEPMERAFGYDVYDTELGRRAVEKLLDLSGCNPTYLMRLCSQMFAYFVSDRCPRSRILVSDVEEMVRQFIRELLLTDFDILLVEDGDSVEDPESRKTYQYLKSAAFATVKSFDQRTSDMKEINRKLTEEQGYSTEEIERTKNLLEARRVISITSGGRVKINTGLFVEFMLQKNGGRE